MSGDSTGDDPPTDERDGNTGEETAEAGVTPDGGETADPDTPPADVDLDDLYQQLEELEQSITTTEQRRELQETRQVLQRLPVADQLERITKYTTRDMGEAFVGALVFALPMLVEDGIFVIAEHLLDRQVAGIPVFLAANIAFTITLTAGLIYVVDIREVQISNPILGVVPRRLVGVLAVSYLTSLGLLAFWGRTKIGDPTALETFARTTVVWTVAALGASLGDILPGESKGTDLIIRNIDDIVDFDD